jgi:hypothetical protein
LPWRYARNVATVLYAGMGALVVLACVVAVALLLDALNVSLDAREAVIRPGGVAVAMLLVVPVLRQRARFRAALLADAAARRLLDPTGRLTHAGLVAWLAATLVVLVGFGFRPDLWPL